LPVQDRGETVGPAGSHPVQRLLQRIECARPPVRVGTIIIRPATRPNTSAKIPNTKGKTKPEAVVGEWPINQPSTLLPAPLELSTIRESAGIVAVHMATPDRPAILKAVLLPYGTTGTTLSPWFTSVIVPDGRGARPSARPSILAKIVTSPVTELGITPPLTGTSTKSSTRDAIPPIATHNNAPPATKPTTRTAMPLRRWAEWLRISRSSRISSAWGTGTATWRRRNSLAALSFGP